jgi:hypothetical protein
VTLLNRILYSEKHFFAICSSRDLTNGAFDDPFRIFVREMGPNCDNFVLWLFELWIESDQSVVNSNVESICMHLAFAHKCHQDIDQMLSISAAVLIVPPGLPKT